MLGNFSYFNPMKLYFGVDALKNSLVELEKYGRNVALVYGGGSVRKNRRTACKRKVSRYESMDERGWVGNELFGTGCDGRNDRQYCRRYADSERRQ